MEELRVKARQMRQLVIEMLMEAGSGHTGGPLGSADFWTALYFGGELNYDPKDPWKVDRDRVILSAGHYCPIQYACLAEAGFFPKEELMTLRKTGSRLQGHPIARSLPGVENTSGPLGQGVSQALGVALVGRLEKQDWRVYCFMGDGEQQEGEIWEAYLLAGRERLANLTLVVDRNNMQIDGHTEEVMPLEPLVSKLSAFNLNVIEVDGHDMEAIIRALKQAKATYDKTSVIILKTIPGKGVSFMENDVSWHGKAPSEEEGEKALQELADLS